MRSTVFFAGLSALAFARGAQQPLRPSTGNFNSAQYDAGLFTPFGDLHAVSAEEYTTLRHPGFPGYGIRIKESQWCDGDVRSYTGYIDIEARHLFFYFFESRRDPDTDDVVFWTSGGPGGSSAMGLLMELGPCRVTGPNTTERFDYAWNDHANVFFVDQPVGVGFSYAEYGETVTSTIQGGRDIAAFMSVFFEHFHKFKGRPLHMAGESYGGRYIPVYAAAVYDNNAKLIEAGFTPINLTSVMIGNGCTDVAGMTESYYEVQCMDYGFPKLTSVSDCVRMKQLLPRCRKKVQESCRDVVDSINCNDAYDFCTYAFVGIFDRYNPYDANRPCKDDNEITVCYPEAQWVDSYLHIPAIQYQLGVDPQHADYTMMNLELNAQFRDDAWDFRAEHYLAALLERGIRALIYVGVNDWICNWVGNQRMTSELEWTGQEIYNSQPLREWSVNGEVAGKTRSWGPLTFATIDGAGHMAPFDQPERSLELVNRWLAGEEL